MKGWRKLIIPAYSDGNNSGPFKILKVITVVLGSLKRKKKLKIHTFNGLTVSFLYSSSFALILATISGFEAATLFLSNGSS